MEKKHYTKRFMALLILVFTTTGIMYAAPRSLEQARKIATAQIKKHSVNKLKAHSGTVTAINPQLVQTKKKQNKDEAYYYVFSAGDNLGYTIVSGDDRLPEIVGYTESGNYDANKLPGNLASFMQAYQDFADNATDEQIEEIRQWKAQAKHDAVAPLMAEKWNQTAPYNNMCPEIKYNETQGDRAVTGCVATAIAQILHHYKCPDKLKNNIPAYTATTVIYSGYKNEINMPEISTEDGAYDWQNMLNEYTGNETQAQNDAVAKLMLHAGCAVKMNYNPKSSSASATAEAFTKYFGMDKELVRKVQRNSYNLSQWDKMLYDEIAAKRPVLYEGQSTGGGHAFVVHGYDDGLYFVNWGWGGYCDGYFDITILNPHSTSGAGASTSDDGYSMDNDMIIGIVPDNGVEDKVDMPKITSYKKLQIDNISINGTQLTATVICSPLNRNLDGETNVSIGYADNNGKYINIGTPFKIDSKDLAQGYFYENCPISISLKYEEGKTYNLCLIENVDQQNWAACPGEELTSTAIKIENNTCTVVSQNHKLTASAALDKDSSGNAETGNTINITVSNSGDKEYYDRVYVMVGTGETMPEVYTYATGITAPANGSTTLSFTYTPPTAGTYNFWVLDSSLNEIGKSSINFADYGTAINDINAETMEKAVYYNLRGEKVKAPTKGIYVKNGKKYLLK